MLRRMVLLMTVLSLLAMFSAPTSARDGNSPELSAEYDYVNFTYFEGRLPNVTIHITEEKPAEWIAQTIPCGLRCFSIVISDAWAPAETEKQEALIHEMCHVFTDINGTTDFDVHGPHWNACMTRLANRGAFDPQISGRYSPVW